MTQVQKLIYQNSANEGEQNTQSESSSEKEDMMNATRIRLAAISLIFSGVMFVLFPVVRQFSNEASLQGAVAFASIQWVVAHSLAMFGFILLVLGFLGLYIQLRRTRGERLAFGALALSFIGIGLTLPFFGAEAFSLQAIGRAAANQDSTALFLLVNQVRFGPGIIFIVSGLILVAIGVILMALAVKSGYLPKWSGVPLAIGFVVYIPQLQGDPIFQPIRIALGLLIAFGSSWLAWGMLSYLSADFQEAVKA